MRRREEKLAALKTNRFKQQELRAWRPVPSYGSTMIIFIVFGALFMLLGITLYLESDKVQTAVFPYGEECKDVAVSECSKTFTIASKMPAPVYVYYELTNFYQNHRRYVLSRSMPQLMGKQIVATQADQCSPIIYNSDLDFVNGTALSYVNGSQLDPNAYAYPCGLIAKSVFNDTFSLVQVNLTTGVDIKNITMDDSNIAWKSDVNKFKNQQDPSVQWQNVEDCKF